MLFSDKNRSFNFLDELCAPYFTEPFSADIFQTWNPSNNTKGVIASPMNSPPNMIILFYRAINNFTDSTIKYMSRYELTVQPWFTSYMKSMRQGLAKYLHTHYSHPEPFNCCNTDTVRKLLDFHRGGPQERPRFKLGSKSSWLQWPKFPMTVHIQVNVKSKHSPKRYLI